MLVEPKLVIGLGEPERAQVGLWLHVGCASVSRGVRHLRLSLALAQVALSCFQLVKGHGVSPYTASI